MIQNMFAFRKDETEKVVKRLGYIISRAGNIIEKKEIVRCSGCGCFLNKSNLGMITPGSKIPFCDNPACYSKYLAEHEGVENGHQR